MSFYDKLLRRAASADVRRQWKHARAMRRIGLTRNPDRKKPPESGIAVPVVPPRGPLPLHGGAEAPLEFDRG